MRKRHWSYQGEKNRLIVLRRDDYRCQLRLDGCLVTARTVDHIVPRELGGPDNVENLQSACSRCNGRKGRRTDVVQRPRSTPVFRDVGFTVAPLLNTPPRSRWEALTPAAYRKDG